MLDVLTRPTDGTYRSLVSETSTQIARRFESTTQPFSEAPRADLAMVKDAAGLDGSLAGAEARA